MKIDLIKERVCNLHTNYRLVVSRLTIEELAKMVNENEKRATWDQEKFICHLISKNCLAEYKNVTLQTVRDRYLFIISPENSLNVIATIVNNLPITKRIRTVANNAIRNPKCRASFSITELSKSKTWESYIESFSTNDVEIRRIMVRQVLENAPGLVFPDLVYEVWRSND